MSTEEFLRENEDLAVGDEMAGGEVFDERGGADFISNVRGREQGAKRTKLTKTKSFGAGLFILALVVVFGVLFSSGNLIPDAISQRLIEETDVQYADAVESKKLVFQQALLDGYLPDDTTAILKVNDVLVGYSNGGEFVEDNKAGVSLSLKMGDKIITAQELIRELDDNVKLYNAFTEATYSRAAYYYDEDAEDVFRSFGTDRDNYTNTSDFDGVMDRLLGKGSNIDFNTVSLVEKTRENENGETETYYEYEENGAAARSGAAGFIDRVSEKNLDQTVTNATYNTADALKVADTISKEQRSSLYYLAFMENISKMKAGEGNESKINEAMNYLHRVQTSEVTDVETGATVTVSGSPLESPSLYMVLSGEKTNLDSVKNYSSDRILKLVENQMNSGSGASAIDGTITSTETKTRGSIGRLILFDDASPDRAVLDKASNTVDKSLINNEFDTIYGINAGEFLVEGAVNVGKELAKKSGAAAGDSQAAVEYARLTSKVLAMDAAADRLNRSPFDITSKNTFLGSLVYKFAITNHKSVGILSSIGSSLRMFGAAITSLLPRSYADATEDYLTKFGECETYGTIGAVGTMQCAQVATFDTSTLNDTFNDPEFIAFVNENTAVDGSGTRTVLPGSKLAKYIIYNDERITPLGVTDGGIIDSLINGSSDIPFVSSILKLVLLIFGIPQEYKDIATGKTYVNTGSNGAWQSTYKYAQRYISLARATSALRQYTNDKTAYNNIKYFEGAENPVVAFLKDYYQVASR